MDRIQAIVMNTRDNVCTVVEPVTCGMEVCFNRDGRRMSIQAMDSIPSGHKLAISPIKQGDPIVKYGEVIGLATQDVALGRHVHVHNLESCRGRGDR